MKTEFRSKNGTASCFSVTNYTTVPSGTTVSLANKMTATPITESHATWRMRALPSHTTVPSGTTVSLASTMTPSRM